MYGATAFPFRGRGGDTKYTIILSYNTSFLQKNRDAIKKKALRENLSDMKNF